MPALSPYLVSPAAAHPIDTAEGRSAAPGDRVDIDPDLAHNEALIADGALIPLPTPKPTPKPKRSRAGKPDPQDGETQ